jgi:hypothetical protein
MSWINRSILLCMPQYLETVTAVQAKPTLSMNLESFVTTLVSVAAGEG